MSVTQKHETRAVKHSCLCRLTPHGLRRRRNDKDNKKMKNTAFIPDLLYYVYILVAILIVYLSSSG
jgi:hypothetical protein